MLSTLLLNAQTITITETISDYAGYGVSANGASDGHIYLTVSGGTDPYTFSWSNGESTDYLTNLSAGIYSVTVTDDVSVTETATYTLTEIAVPLNVNFTAQDPTCNGSGDGWVEAQPSGGTPPYTYLWDNGSVTQGVYNLGEGMYSVTVTDDDNNNFYSFYELYEPSEIEIDGMPYMYANGQFFSCPTCADGELTITASGGNPPYTYLWHNGETNNVLTNIASGDALDITVTDASGCSVNDGGVLMWIEPLVVTEVLSSYPNGYNISGDGMMDGSIDLSVSGGVPPYDFNWDDGSTDEDRYNLGEGNYMVTVTDDYGQQYNNSYYIAGPPSASPFTVTENISDYNGYQVSVQGANDGYIELNVTGGTPPYQFNWDDANTDQHRYNLSEGTYSVTVTDDNGGYFSNTYYLYAPSPTQVFVNANISMYPNGYNVSAQGVADGYIELYPSGGTPPYTYLWSDGTADQFRYGLAEGEYHATVTDDDGNSHGSNYWVLGPPASPNMSVTLKTDYNACWGSAPLDAEVFDGMWPLTFNWEGPNGNIPVNDWSIDIYEGGNYSVTVTDDNGNVATASLWVDDQPMSVNVSTPFLNGGSNNASCAGGDGSIEISINGGSPPYDIEINNYDDGYYDEQTTSDAFYTINGLSAGWYSIMVMDMYGCQEWYDLELVGPENIKVDVTVTELSNGNYFSCPTCADGAATGQVLSGGNGNYTYQWFSLDPAAATDIDFKGASMFASEPIMFADDFDENTIVPLNLGQSITGLTSEFWYGLYVVDDEGCEGAKFFNLEKPKQGDPAWGLNGNSGAGNWLGTNDATDLDLLANNQTLLKLRADGVTEVPGPLALTGIGVPLEPCYGRVLSINTDGFVGVTFVPCPPPDCESVLPWSVPPDGNTANVSLCNDFENVGIGYISPTHKLHVSGTVKLSGPVGIGIDSDDNVSLRVRGLAGITDIGVLIESYDTRMAFAVKEPGSLAEIGLRIFGNGQLEIIGDNSNIPMLNIMDEAEVEAFQVYSDGKTIVGNGYFNATNDVASLYLGDVNHYISAVRGQGLSFSTYDEVDAMIIEQGSGNVGIGVDHSHNFAGYKLAVCGNIRATKLVVEEGWCDYVFAEDYDLRPLSEVADFIDANQHLPGIPPAIEIETNGLDVGELIKLQMEKIEELTLYMIQLQNKVTELEERLAQQNSND